VAGIGGAHHVLGIELLLCELGHGEGTVLLRATGGEGSEAHHEEVETRERNHVHGKLAEIAVELTREAEAAGGAADSSRDKVVEVTVCGGGELEGAEADIVESLVIKGEALVGVFDKLVDREGGVVGLDDGVGHLGGGDDGVGRHDTIGVLLTDLGDEEGAHTRASSTTHGVGHLETLEAVAGLSLLADNVKHGVNELSTLGVVALGPVVTSTSLAEDEVVGAEELAERSGTDGVHGTGLKIHEDGTGDIATTGGLVEVHGDTLELEIGVTVVCAGGVNTVLVGDDLPELGADLVAALAALNVNDFSHLLEIISIIRDNVGGRERGKRGDRALDNEFLETGVKRPKSFKNTLMRVLSAPAIPQIVTGTYQYYIQAMGPWAEAWVLR